MSQAAPSEGDVTRSSAQQEALRRIGRDLERGLRALPYVVGAFFAGSAANGELLVDVSDGNRLLGDVEVGVVTTRPWRKREVRAVAADVGKAHDVEIDAFLVTRTRLRRGLHKNIGLSTRSASVFAYEISTAARWLYGRDDVECKVWRASDIHPWEGVRLILNRLGEGAPWLLADDISSSSRERSRWLVKTLTAAGDALLLSGGQFAPSYGARAKLWDLHGRTFLADGSGRAAVAQAFRARVEGLAAPFDVDETVWIHVARAGVEAGLAASGCRLPTVDAKRDPRDFGRLLRDARLPSLHTLGFRSLDGAFDSLLRSPRIRHPRVHTRAVLADWRGKGCLQHWAYGPLVAGLVETGSKGCYDAMRRAIEPFFDTDALADGALVRAWWQVMCR